MMANQGIAQFQKHFNAEIEEVVDSRTITFEQLSEHFHLPINEVLHPFILLFLKEKRSLFFFFFFLKQNQNKCDSYSHPSIFSFFFFFFFFFSYFLFKGGKKTWCLPNCLKKSLSKTRNPKMALSQTQIPRQIHRKLKNLCLKLPSRSPLHPPRNRNPPESKN